MGHDFVIYGDRRVHLNDFTIWAIRHFCLRATYELSFTPPATSGELAEVAAFFEQWNWIGPGVYMGTNIDEFVKSDASRLALLRSVIRQALRAVGTFGELISYEYLQANINRKDAYYTASTPAAPIVEGLQKLEQMLNDDCPAA